jgi:hypothetical protein
MTEDDWRWHMYDTVKGSDWLGDQVCLHSRIYMNTCICMHVCMYVCMYDVYRMRFITCVVRRPEQCWSWNLTVSIA